jgi:beta-barrel assembly-enhancing protease
MKLRVLFFMSLLCVSPVAGLIYAESKNSNVEDIGNRDINKGNINFTSLEKEIALGRSLSAEIEKQVKLVSDPEVTEYVSRVGQNIVRNSDAKVPFTIKVIDSEEINAFALPGGFLYVNSGLITTADEESELAGVLAHEIAHVAARHGTEQQAKATIADFARIPLVIFSGGLAQLVYNVYGLVVPLQFLQFSRGAEAEADYLGVQYMYKTGYDPASFISYFEKVQAQEKKKPGRLSKIFSTHPPTADRIEKSQKNIATVLPDRDEYVLSTSEFDKIKAKLIALDNARKPAPGEDSKRPTLKRRTPTVDGSDEPQPSDDDRPTLKRRTPQAIS